MASASSSDAARAATPATATARRLTAPVTTGLSARPAVASRPASKKSLDQPIENCPAITAGMTSPMGPAPCGAACAASSAIIAEIASDGPGCPARTSARTRFATPTAFPDLRPPARFPRRNDCDHGKAARRRRAARTVTG